MSSARSDASTSTDTLQGQPLCLFYFEAPFGVLSASPPLLLEMPPGRPWPFFSSTPYGTSSSESKPSFDLGNATIHKRPLNLIKIPDSTCNINLHESISSSLFTDELWFDSASTVPHPFPRRLVPYHGVLPPLQLPLPTIRDDSSSDLWSTNERTPVKVSLPPISLPKKVKKEPEGSSCDTLELSDVKCAGGGGRVRRGRGVRKARGRAQLSGLRRSLAGLLQRSVKGAGAGSPALREVLAVVRDAWPTGRRADTTRTRRNILRSKQGCSSACERDSDSVGPVRVMQKRSQWAELPSRAGASPGLLRRRYSVPEIIMRKYRLAQLNSDTEECVVTTAGSRGASPASPQGSCSSLCEAPPRCVRRDRELMRRSALMRRLWGRNNTCQTCTYCNTDLDEPRATRSLDGYHSELRHSSSRQSRDSNLPAGWATPKRQRLDRSAENFHSSDEMLRIAMRNSYDKVEKELKAELSDSTYQSHTNIMSTYLDSSSDTPCTDSHAYKSNETSSENKQTTESSSEKVETSTITAEDSTSNNVLSSESAVAAADNNSTDTSESCSVSIPTTKEVTRATQTNTLSKPGHIDVQVNEASDHYENDDKNISNYFMQTSPGSKPYEVLEIVVSETLDTQCSINNLPITNYESTNKLTAHGFKPTLNYKYQNNIDIDEYVSNILVESLNSLTNQLESMNASIASDRKISIVEKEIKVKLQNTGVNTIVHLSPTSNNPIIFGNKELCNDNNQNDTTDLVNNNQILIREGVLSPESNNNASIDTFLPDAKTSNSNFYEENDRSEKVNSIISHENVNKAVLQQIQKLFQEELHNITQDTDYPDNMMPGISHIEISNVDVFIDNNRNENYETAETIELHTERNYRNEDSFVQEELISGVGTGNYFEDLVKPIVVPRFTAFPQTESMEVNTSCSDDPEALGSDCTSLVDSLDDPNSPRSLILKKAYCNLKRSELVRSSIDILNLLPENDSSIAGTPVREKGESFFIRISDNDCDCEKENIVVAEHMPEKIKQRLFKRHKKRELRMECAKHKKLNKEIEKQKYNAYLKSKKSFERECMAVVNSLVDEVIHTIALDEYKCARIRQKSKHSVKKYQVNSVPKPWQKSNESLHTLESIKISRHGDMSFSKMRESKDVVGVRTHRPERQQVKSKLSLQKQSQSSSDDGPSRRVYQKSEIQDGNKRIEILEILEYAEDSSNSSPEGTNSDESHCVSFSKRKSRIPVPIFEKNHKPHRLNNKDNDDLLQLHKSTVGFSDDEETGRLIANMLLGSLNSNINSYMTCSDTNKLEALPRRASVPHQECKSRSNSLRFRQMFDIIPEEKSSLSVESSNEDITYYQRRVSAPTLPNETQKKKGYESPKSLKCMQNASTSPVVLEKASRTVMTSPMRRSTATSPIPRGRAPPPPSPPPPPSGATPPPRAGWLGFCARDAGDKNNIVSESSKADSEQRKTASTQYEQSVTNQSTVRTIEVEKPDTIIVSNGKTKSKYEKVNKEVSKKSIKDTKQNADEKFKVKKRSKENKLTRSLSDSQTNEVVLKKRDKHKFRMISVEKSEEERVRVARDTRRGTGGAEGSSSDSESGSSLLCSLAPRWLAAGRARRHAKRDAQHAAVQQPRQAAGGSGHVSGSGWSVTLAGGGGAALPADVEMRLSFPPPAPAPPPHHTHASPGNPANNKGRDTLAKLCSCRHCAECECREGRSPPAPSLPPAPLTALALRKQSTASSILDSKSRKTSDVLPELQYRTRARSRRAVQTRRACSLHCWLPPDDELPLQASEGLLVCGEALVPHHKPRVPSMSERDLTRVARRPPQLTLPRRDLRTLV